MKFVIEQETLEKTMSYLATKPFNEVIRLIQELEKCQPLQEAGPITTIKEKPADGKLTK